LTLAPRVGVSLFILEFYEGCNQYQPVLKDKFNAGYKANQLDKLSTIEIAKTKIFQLKT
jgi:hypothetical protein